MEHCNTCGTKTVRHQFTTFGYDYCEKCKLEVTVKPHDPLDVITQIVNSKLETKTPWHTIDVPDYMRGSGYQMVAFYKRMKYIDADKSTGNHYLTLDDFLQAAMRLK